MSVLRDKQKRKPYYGRISCQIGDVKSLKNILVGHVRENAKLKGSYERIRKVYKMRHYTQNNFRKMNGRLKVEPTPEKVRVAKPLPEVWFGTYSKCRLFSIYSAMRVDLVHSDFILCEYQYPIASKVMRVFLIRRLAIARGSHNSSNLQTESLYFTPDKLLKIVLMFGLKKENLGRRFIKIENEARKLVSDNPSCENLNGLMYKTFSGKICKFFNYWAVECVRELVGFVRRKENPNVVFSNEKIDLDKYMRDFEGRRGLFSAEKIQETLGIFNKIVNGKRVFILNPQLLYRINT